MALSDTQQEEIFRILGYPHPGTAVPGNTGYPSYASALGIWQPYAVLLNRLNTMTIAGEVELYGSEHPSFGTFLTQSTLAVTVSTGSFVDEGAVLTADVDGNLVSYTTIVGDTPATVALALANAVNGDASISESFLANCAGAIATLYSREAGQEGNGYGVQVITSDPTLLVAVNGGTAARSAAGFTAGGSNPPGPRFTPDDNTDPICGFVPIIRILEGDQINSRSNLDMESVSGSGGGNYTPRKNELVGRSALLKQWRRRMADFLNVPIDPDLVGNRRASRVRAR